MIYDESIMMRNYNQFYCLVLMSNLPHAFNSDVGCFCLNTCISVQIFFKLILMVLCMVDNGNW